MMLDTRPTAVLAAFPIGLVIGLLDTRSAEVQGPALLLLLAGAGLGALAPRAAVTSGVLVGLGVPAVHAYVRLAGIALPYPMNGYWGSFLALVPALVGAVGAALMRGTRLPPTGAR